jgi:thioredoxin-dependent peroxiredoxin
MAQLDAGSRAPQFELPGDGGKTISLAAHSGKPVILFFYPKDDTSGCTAEALDFSQLKPQFDALGAVLIGMSPDSPKRHDKFKAKHELTVDLASDETKTTLEAYGVWVEKSMYGRKYMGVERSTFLIRPDGTIGKVWRKVKVPGHAEDVLKALRDS